MAVEMIKFESPISTFIPHSLQLSDCLHSS